jgi:hypothetical protein
MGICSTVQIGRKCRAASGTASTNACISGWLMQRSTADTTVCRHTALSHALARGNGSGRVQLGRGLGGSAWDWVFGGAARVRAAAAGCTRLTAPASPTPRLPIA